MTTPEEYADKVVEQFIHKIKGHEDRMIAFNVMVDISSWQKKKVGFVGWVDFDIFTVGPDANPTVEFSFDFDLDDIRAHRSLYYDTIAAVWRAIVKAVGQDKMCVWR